MESGFVVSGIGEVAVDRKVKFKGEAIWELRDKNGNLKASGKATNGVTDVGINKLLDIAFGSTAKFANWFMGLIDSTSYTGLNSGDTLASHTGFVENTAYTVTAGSTQRGTWTPAAASGKSVANGTAVAFTMTGAGTIKGFLLCSDQLKATTTGTLWATALFATGDQVVAIGDILNVTYTISAA